MTLLPPPSAAVPAPPPGPLSSAAPPSLLPPAPRPLELPLIGHSYPELMRTPRARWWQPLGSLGIVLAALTALTVAVSVPMTAALVHEAGWEAFFSLDPADAARVEEALFSAPVLLLNNAILVAFIGVALLAVAVAHPVAARFVHSVEGRVRWRWLLRAHLTVLPLFLVYVLGTWAADGAPTAPRADDWIWLLLMALLVTPFQAAGEEYLFRGWLMLAVGTWIRRPVVAVVVSAVVSAVVFSLAHGSLDPWILADLSTFAVACVVLTWRTGGLEAAIALHAVNNVVLMVVGALAGIGEESYVDAEAAQTPEAALLSMAVIATATALLLWQAKRAGIARTVPAGVGARP